MNITVIGGAGFIGLHTAERFLQRGDHVVVLDNLSRPGSEMNLAWLQTTYPKVQFVKADIVKNTDLLQKTLAGTDIVFHLAAQVAVTTSVKDPVADFRTNAEGTLNVLEALRSFNPGAFLVYSSTNKVYGDLTTLPLEETADRFQFKLPRTGVSEAQPLDLYSPYGCSKGAADQYVHDYSRIYGLKTAVFRQSCIYGQRQFGNEDQGWLAWFAVAALCNRPLTLYGSGKQVRDVLYVSDLVDAYEAAVKHADRMKGSIFNIGGGPSNTLSLLELIAQLERFFGRKIPVTHSQERPGDQRIYISDITKARDQLDWSPKTGTAEGLHKMLEWIKSHESDIRNRLKL